MRAERFAHG
jgi:hypothetical protein